MRALTANFLKEKFMNEFRDNKKIGLQSFAAKVTREFNMCPDRWKLSRARKAALVEIFQSGRKICKNYKLTVQLLMSGLSN
jgi:hypothetical protein